MAENKDEVDILELPRYRKRTRQSIYKYLRIGKQNNWCNYNGNGCCRKIMCINTGEVFNSIKEACNKYSLKRLDCYCTHQYKCKVLDSDGKRLEWKYIE